MCNKIGRSIFRGIVLTLGLGMTSSALGGDFQWSGLYRVEGYNFKNIRLDDLKQEKAYALNHLVLKPRIVAADGLTIFSRFDLFQSANHPNSQVGQLFGSNNATAATRSDTQKSEDFRVSHLYLTYTQEFGALLVGRAPIQFGLGITHNAGAGMFDHWLDTRDLVGYKVVMGNMFLLPMIAKVKEGDIYRGNQDVEDLMVQFQYDNPESGLSLGVFYQGRSASEAGNDTLNSPGFATDNAGNANETRGAFSVKQTNVYVAQDHDTWGLGFEGSMLTGKTGIYDVSDTENIDINAFGVALEAHYQSEGSLWKWKLLTGYATGDDPETDDTFEGYFFDRNYNVAMMLMNHTMGTKDVYRTQDIGAGSTKSLNDVDVEAVSNVFYVAPGFEYTWSDKWSIHGALITGVLTEKPTVDSDKGLGYEVDLSVNFMPNNRVTWSNQLGLLFPGDAFKVGSSNPSFAYGLATKAAISF